MKDGEEFFIMNTSFTLHTERLILKPLVLADASAYSLLGVSYRSTGALDNEIKAQEYLKKSLQSEDSFDVGIFLDEKLTSSQP